MGTVSRRISIGNQNEAEECVYIRKKANRAINFTGTGKAGVSRGLTSSIKILYGKRMVEDGHPRSYRIVHGQKSYRVATFIPPSFVNRLQQKYFLLGLNKNCVD